MKLTPIAAILCLLLFACTPNVTSEDQTQVAPEPIQNVTGSVPIIESQSQSNTAPKVDNAKTNATEQKSLSKTHIITIDNNGFRPAAITIASGDTILWKNERTTSGAMSNAYIIGSSASCRRPKLQSKYPPGINVGETFNHTFTEKGECIYVDGIQTTKKGTITIR